MDIKTSNDIIAKNGTVWLFEVILLSWVQDHMSKMFTTSNKSEKNIIKGFAIFNLLKFPTKQL
jgi:hypothetical protein